MRCGVLVLCGLIVIVFRCAKGAAIPFQTYTHERERATQSREDGNESTGRNLDFYGQYSSEYNSQSSEYGLLMNPFTEWQKYVPNVPNYNLAVPNMQIWQMYIPQNAWNGELDYNGYQQFPNDGRPAGKPWNWNFQGWIPNFNQPKPPRPEQWNENPHHHHHHHQHPYQPYPQVKPPGFEEFPHNHNNQGIGLTTGVPEGTPSPVFPFTSKPPQVTTSTTEGGYDEVYDIDIRSGFAADAKNSTTEQ